MTEPAVNLENLVAEAVNTASAVSSARLNDDSAVAVNSQANRPLYQSRIKVHPKVVHGTFRRVKWLVMAITLSIYYVTPFIRWNRGPGMPDQAVLLDFPARRFYFFFLEIWPQEFYYVTGLLILAALGLFLATSVAGRVWCGYTCPQTVWTDLFVFVERLFEGDRSARIRLDKEGWSVGKFARKAGKHAVWLLIAILTGGAWVFYFADAPTLAMQMVTFSAPMTAYIFVGLFTATTYTLGGIAREQVCIYMCPWPRIQGAMFDEESLLVSYKDDRGEKRGPHKKGTSWEGRGDCIDCGQCVAACPVGIDIRDGMQLECIQCALCIDACNEIMDKVERPRGLIGYDTLGNQERRKAGKPPRFRIVRPRTIVYAVALLLVSAIMVVALASRETLQLNILRDRNPLFVTLSDGSVRNGYGIKIINKDTVAHTIHVSIDGLEGARLAGISADDVNPTEIEMSADALKNVRFYVSLPKDRVSELDGGYAKLNFVVTDETGRRTVKETTFRGPDQ
ncbi:cytochrome c oxidase accessory protein CcoG [Parvibaculum sp.]|uniref:cytochrome c oxidase accessory protein CcoG n=1 Tax=Parvibaculum sp. TaxID=2024848 RepID=UPI00320E6E23